jgi:hypothetical protein
MILRWFQLLPLLLVCFYIPHALCCIIIIIIIIITITIHVSMSWSSNKVISKTLCIGVVAVNTFAKCRCETSQALCGDRAAVSISNVQVLYWYCNVLTSSDAASHTCPNACTVGCCEPRSSNSSQLPSSPDRRTPSSVFTAHCTSRRYDGTQSRGTIHLLHGFIITTFLSQVLAIY